MFIEWNNQQRDRTHHNSPEPKLLKLCIWGKKQPEKSVSHFPLSGPNGFPALPTEDTSHFNVPFLNQLFSMFKSNTRKCKLWSQFKSCTPLGLDGPETPPKFWFYIPFPQVKMSSLSNCNSHSRFKKKTSRKPYFLRESPPATESKEIFINDSLGSHPRLNQNL